MDHAHQSRLQAPTARPGLRLTLLAAAPAVYALLYPGMVDVFHNAVGDAGHRTQSGGALVACIMLVLMFSVPVYGFLRAVCGIQDAEASPLLRLRARRLGYAVVVAPTMYCMLGVMQILLHSPVPDEVAWVLLWLVTLAWAMRMPKTHAPPTYRPLAQLRVAHGVSALILVSYVTFHLTNHLFAWIGQEAHAQVMALGRKVYRSPVGEPILVLAMLFQVTTGLILAWRWSAQQLDVYRTFQVASGFYLSIYVLGHMNSVFVLARAFFGIDTGWDFATGAPNGLIHDAWSARLIPHYALGVFLIIGHLFSGLRSVMLAHGTKTETANRTWWAGASFGALLATLIMLAMCGMRL
ncbi:hypothetical protein ABIE56_002407 [Luteibacter sp. 621]|uniref:hypothetical protein n=1 Tax=Luteibacter sp. 621 TaxID=3373916 RepID=UPI003D199CD3